MISRDCSGSVIGDSYERVADFVQFPRRKIESVFSDAAPSDSPFLVKPFRQFSFFVFHLVFLCLERSRQPVWIAFENKSKSKLAQQADCTESQNGAINSAHLEVVLRFCFLH